MRASELIAELGHLFETHGDLPVIAICVAEQVATVTVLQAGGKDWVPGTVATEFYLGA